MKPHLEALNMDFDILADTNVPEHPPWLLRKPSVILQLTELRKSGTHPLEYQRLHAKIQCQFEDHISIYTDGSKDQGHIAAAAAFLRLKFGVQIPDKSCIFKVEAQALGLALECIVDSDYTNYVVYSDSFSCLQAISGLKTDHPFVGKVISKMNQLTADGYDLAMLVSEEMSMLIGLQKRL